MYFQGPIDYISIYTVFNNIEMDTLEVQITSIDGKQIYSSFSLNVSYNEIEADYLIINPDVCSGYSLTQGIGILVFFYLIYFVKESNIY